MELKQLTYIEIGLLYLKIIKLIKKLKIKQNKILRNILDMEYLIIIENVNGDVKLSI